jgi:hypothetical protein
VGSEDVAVEEHEPDTDADTPEEGTTMDTVELAPDAILIQDNLTGDLDTIDNSPYAPNGQTMNPFEIPTEPSLLRVSFPTPSNFDPAGTQKFAIFVKASTGIPPVPKVSIAVYNAGVLATQSPLIGTTEAGTLIEFEWAGSLADPADGSAVEAELQISNAAASAMLVDAVAWVATISQVSAAGPDWDLTAPGADYSLVMP